MALGRFCRMARERMTDRIYKYCSVAKCDRKPAIVWTWTTDDMPLTLDFPVCDFHKDVVRGSSLLDKAFESSE